MRFRKDIQGLRAVAVLAVLAEHFGIKAMRGGFAGVDVFFVISGFLIVGLMLAEVERTGRIALLNFYGRRVRRIFPAALTVIALTAGISTLLMNPLIAADIRQDSRWAALFVINVLLIRQGADYFARYDSVSPLQHYWSLAVEEQFYLVAPVLLTVIILLTKNRVYTKRVITLVIGGLSLASFLWCVYATKNISASNAYFSTLTRVWQLGSGALLAIVIANEKVVIGKRLNLITGLAGTAFLGASFVFLKSSTYPGWQAVFPIIGSALIILAGSSKSETVVQKAFSTNVLVFTGLISFSLYLCHWPLMLLMDKTITGFSNTPLRVPILFVCSYLVAVILYYIVENPFRKIRPSDRSFLVQHKRTVAVGALVSFITLVSATSLIETKLVNHGNVLSADKGITKSLDARVRLVKDSLKIKTLPSGLNPRLSQVPEDRESMRCLTIDTFTINSCASGNKNAKRVAIVIGDSHAHMWLTAIKKSLPKKEWRVITITRGGCPTADIPPPPEKAVLGGKKACTKHREWVRKEIAKQKPDLVISSEIAGSIHSKGKDIKERKVKEWKDGLKRSLLQIKPYTKKIVIIGQTPQAKALKDCLPSNLALDSCVGSDKKTKKLRAIEQDVAKQTGAYLIDPSVWLCVKDKCPPVIANSAVYFDDNHVTISLEKQVAALMKAEFASVL